MHISQSLGNRPIGLTRSNEKCILLQLQIPIPSHRTNIAPRHEYFNLMHSLQTRSIVPHLELHQLLKATSLATHTSSNSTAKHFKCPPSLSISQARHTVTALYTTVCPTRHTTNISRSQAVKPTSLPHSEEKPLLLMWEAAKACSAVIQKTTRGIVGDTCFWKSTTTENEIEVTNRGLFFYLNRSMRYWTGHQYEAILRHSRRLRKRAKCIAETAY